MCEGTTELFIELVKKENILWDLNNPNYKNIKKKAQVWRNISIAFGMPVDACKKKWKALRDCCARDLIKNPTSAQDTEEPETSWKYRDHMKFLKDHIKPRITKSNFDSFSDGLSLQESPNMHTDEHKVLTFDEPLHPPTFEFNVMQSPDPKGPSSSNSPHSQSAKKKKVCMESTFVSTMESVQEFLSKPCQLAPLEPDEDELFFQSMMKKIQRFPRKIKNDVKVQMLQYLNDIENQLDENFVATWSNPLLEKKVRRFLS